MSVRVRIAPSPTGMAHIGTARTFLFNWLFARQRGGAFVIRIEDTDRERLVPGAVESLIDAIRWLGLDWDEGPEVGGPYGPYVQSERLALYHTHVDQLVQDGNAYRCYCSSERLDQLRKDQQARGEPPGYDRRCRNLSDRERAEFESSGTGSVIRFAVPSEGSTTFDDVIHGSITWENARLDDFVILKSDGYPTYHLAHLVDDHLMEISHVLRGDEWISSTPRHLLLYEALGWEPPAFAHLPAILGSDGKKLSKRHGPTGIAAFQEGGYLPEAMVNYLALCGWSPGTDEEVFSLPELVRRFALERVSKSGAIFDHDKLEWFNGLHIRAQSPADLAERMRPFLPGKNRDIAAERLEPIARLLQDRLKTLAEVPELTDFFFQDPLDYDLALLVRPGMDNQATARALAAAANLARQVSPFVHEALEAAYRQLCLELGLKTTQLFMAVRVAVTGKTATPPLFETMTVLGRDVVISRLEAAAAKLAPN